VAIIAVGFSFIGCDNDPKGDKDLSGDITITPTTATTGTELAAIYSGTETVNYQWNKNETAIDGITNVKFTPNEIGSYTVTVSLADYKSKTSDAVEVTPAPEEQTKNFTISADDGYGAKTMTVIFWAVTDDDPVWWGDLVAAAQNRQGEFTAGNHTLTVTPTGTAGFVIGADGKATVSEAFLLNPPRDVNKSVYDALRIAINESMDGWVN
jgi:hypothetical protein